MNRAENSTKINRLLAESLFIKHQARLRHRISHSIHRHHAEDLTAETFTVFLERLPELNLIKPLDNYLLGIFKNQLRKPLTGRSLSIEEHRIKLPVYDQNPLQQLIRRQLCRSVHTALDTLPAHIRTTVKKFHWDNQSQQLIREQTGIPIRTLQRHLHRGRTLLKNRLKEWEIF